MGNKGFRKPKILRVFNPGTLDNDLKSATKIFTGAKITLQNSDQYYECDVILEKSKMATKYQEKEVVYKCVGIRLAQRIIATLSQHILEELKDPDIKLKYVNELELLVDEFKSIVESSAKALKENAEEKVEDNYPEYPDTVMEVLGRTTDIRDDGLAFEDGFHLDLPEIVVQPLEAVIEYIELCKTKIRR